MHNKKHVVVYDLDETLGFFSNHGLFCDCVNYIFKDDCFYQNHFNRIMDLYPELLRPGILNILDYLKQKQRGGVCSNVIIYTNNTGPEEWAIQIKDYLNHRIKYNIFDSHIIAAFKVNGRRIEPGRTTHDKTHRDLLNCTDLPENTQIFFLDDKSHPGMEHESIYYINLFPYLHFIPWDTVIERFAKEFKTELHDKKITHNDFHQKAMKYISQVKLHDIEKDPEEYNMESVISLKIIEHLDEFFSQYKNSHKTVRRHPKSKIKNRTVKK